MKKVLNSFEAAIGILLFIAMLIMLNFQILSRMFPVVTNSWTDELCRYAFVWLVYIGSSLAMLFGEHVKIDTMSLIWPKKIRKYMEFFGMLISLAFCGYALYMTTKYTVFLGQNGAVSGSLGFSLVWVYISVNVGYLLVIIRFIQKDFIPLCKTLFGRKQKKKIETEGVEEI